MMVAHFLAMGLLCQRCHFNAATPAKEAITLSAKRAKVQVERTSILGLIARESGGNRFAYNKSSKCYGIGQFKPRTWATVGIKKTDCSVCQIEGMYLRCKYKYGNVANALRHSLRRNWY